MRAILPLGLELVLMLPRRRLFVLKKDELFWRI